MKRLNWEEVKAQPLAESYEETAYRTLSEDSPRSLRGYGHWYLGKDEKRPFNKYLESTKPIRTDLDTNSYINKLNLKGKKLKEGYGAGYNIEFYGIKLQNVNVIRNYRDKYGVQCADFTADIVPKEYDWSASHPAWSLDSRETHYYDDVEFEVEPVKVAGSVKGSWSNGVQSWRDENANDFSEDEIKDEVVSENYDLGYSYSWGWIHSDLNKEWHIPSDNDPRGYIDKSDERSGYKDCYIESADLILDADKMNEFIRIAQDPSDFFDNEDIDESKHNRSLRVRESIRGNTRQFVQNVVDYLNDFMPNDEDWLTMERDILNLRKYSRYRNHGAAASMNDALRSYVEGGYLDVYYNQVNDALNILYMNTPEEAKKWEKYPDEKKWERYVNVMLMYIPKAFKIRMGRELGKMNESKMRESSIQLRYQPDITPTLGEEVLIREPNGNIVVAKCIDDYNNGFQEIGSDYRFYLKDKEAHYFSEDEDEIEEFKKEYYSDLLESKMRESSSVQYHIYGFDGKKKFGPHHFGIKAYYKSKEQAVKIAKNIANHIGDYDVPADTTVIVKEESYDDKGVCTSSKEVWGSLIGSMKESAQVAPNPVLIGSDGNESVYKDVSVRKDNLKTKVTEGTPTAIVAVFFDSNEDRDKAFNILKKNPDELLSDVLKYDDSFTHDEREFRNGRAIEKYDANNKGLIFYIPVEYDAVEEIPSFLEYAQGALNKSGLVFKNDIMYVLDRAILEDYYQDNKYNDVLDHPSMRSIVSNQKIGDYDIGKGQFPNKDRRNIKPTRELESKMREKFWKDPNHPQAKAERDWWRNHVRVEDKNRWKDAWDSTDAEKSLKRFGKIYVDDNNDSPIDPLYVKSLIDEWGDK